LVLVNSIKSFWSGIDDDCFKRLCEFIGICFGIVAANKQGNKKITMRSRLDIKDNKGRIISIDNIKPDFDYEYFEVSKKRIGKEIERKVKTISPVIKSPDLCKGEGSFGHAQKII